MDGEQMLEYDPKLSEMEPVAPAEAPSKPPESNPKDDWWSLGELAIKVAMAAFFVVSIYNMVLPQGAHIGRYWDPYTKLKPFEWKITDVNSEFMRRSVRLRALLKEYGECQPSCSPEFFARKDEVIRTEWPGIFARLRIKNDWSESMQQKSWSYDQVGRINDDYHDAAPIMCVPRIQFYYTKSIGPYSHFEQFVCIPPETPPPQG